MSHNILKILLDLDLDSALKFSLDSYSVSYKFKIFHPKEYRIREIINNYVNTFEIFNSNSLSNIFQIWNKKK